MTGPGKVAVMVTPKTLWLSTLLTVWFLMEVGGHFKGKFSLFLTDCYKHKFGFIRMERHMIKFCPF